MIPPVVILPLCRCVPAGLSEEMLADGYGSITSVDYSPAAIEAMVRRYDRTPLKWAVMDVAERLDFPDATFHAVIDKGTLDSILCGDNSTARSTAYMAEVVRVLKPAGVFIVLSYGDMSTRAEVFSRAAGWAPGAGKPPAVETEPISKPVISGAPAGVGDGDAKATAYHYFYTLSKVA